MRTLPIWAAVCLAGIVAISVNPAFSNDPDKMNSEKIEKLVHADLPAGASKSDVESFFKRHKMSFTFDRFACRYQSLYRVTQFHSILTFVYLDNDQKLKSSETQDIYTGP